MPRFVIQEHYATSHHFDLRLEGDGVLVSRAVPKGMPENAKKNRPAVRVGDYGLSHPDVVDETSMEGVPGAVKRGIRDGGTYEAEELGKEMVILSLRGGRLEGRCATFRAGESLPVHKIEPSGEV
ncbi:MAG: DNA_ligase_IV_Ku-like [uncultured Rubrobacteraceae bacterium]|uniref:DNA_ligase_IV_Ku-like n=1 Tax=uncultured Rubrobacteraceae bacterium TaxID=349277 RepID=A0A6J4RZM7_9ACTN|nr:MAG: DNA_ligase_IV_Ku-like [uncultured Rubrobacteraceae bacterium]